ncbi:Phytanoyl-CoA dioxygenase [Paramyrothecium foliicola]|nr:Phytanoyl-CoA dioxygenase [Paramyrothecium foliicola]
MSTPSLGPLASISSRDDGPLLFALLLGNQNNNNGNNSGETGRTAGPDIAAIPDTVHGRTIALELVAPDLDLSRGRVLDRNGLQGPSNKPRASTSRSADGPTDKYPIAGALDPTRALQPEPATSLQNLRSTLHERKSGALNKQQLQFWREQGYLVLPDTLSQDEATELLRTVYDISDSLARGGKDVQTHLYPEEQQLYVSAVGRALATLTASAFEPDVESIQRIDRLGCGIHRVIPQFRNAIMTSFHEELAKSMGYEDPRIIQSQIIVKAARVGPAIVPHQDGCTGFTDPASCTTFWYALEDCTIENGCLAVAPGSHRVQPITRRCRKDEFGRPGFVDLEKPVFAQVENVSEATLPRLTDDGKLQFKKLEVKAGTLILMHSNLMHTSEPNRSGKTRVAMNFGIIEGSREWLQDNYLQPYDGQTEFECLRG